MSLPASVLKTEVASAARRKEAEIRVILKFLEVANKESGTRASWRKKKLTQERKKASQGTIIDG
jgi:hypothetical protein